MILIIDNYDSFVHNLARYIEQLGVPTRVVRNDQMTVDEIRQLAPQAVVLSPGPCTPSEAGCSLELVRELHTSIPLFGVCLGHQTIAQALGGRVVRAREPFHGRSSVIQHNGRGVFADLPNPLTVGRYHSLVVEAASMPACLEATAWTEDGNTVMAVAHREYPVVGVQFHPESILTQAGYQLLANFIVLSGYKVRPEVSELGLRELVEPPQGRPMPDGPVTF